MCVLFQYSLAYACLKLVNYSFFFWLPFYLSSKFRWKEAEADKLSIWYDVGGIIGMWSKRHHVSQKAGCKRSGAGGRENPNSGLTDTKLALIKLYRMF